MSSALTLGQFIRETRALVQPPMSQEQLSQAAQVSLAYVQRIEQGRALRPSPGFLERIGTALHLRGTELERLQALVRTERLAVVILEVYDGLGVLRNVVAPIADQDLRIQALGTAVVGKKATIWFTLDEPSPEQWRELQKHYEASDGVLSISYRSHDDLRLPRTRRLRNVLPAAALLENPPVVESKGANRSLVAVGWPRVSEVTVIIAAQDRVGLVRDLADVMVRSSVSLSALGTSTRGEDATVWFTMPLPEPANWERIAERLRDIPQVHDLARLSREP